MGLSGFLYVAIVVGWAVYLVPFALRRYDEAARNRSIDRFSSAMRVLGRSDDSAAVDEAGAARRGEAGSAALTAHREVADPRADRTAAKKAARRRRRVLLLLTLATAGIATAAAFALLAWWSIAVPATLLLLWMVVCPIQARRERRARRAATGHDAGRRARHRQAPSGAATQPDAGTRGDEDLQDDVPAADPSVVAQSIQPTDDEPTVVLDPSSGEDDVVGSGSLWDPVPVTLPTYVHKPRAPRTIRTIDLGSAGVQPSGQASGTASGANETAEEPASGEAQATSARAVGE